MTVFSRITFWTWALIALGAACALGLIWLVVRRRGLVAEASCARCGYFVTGLPGPICPECGGVLTEVGIRLPGEVGPMPRGLRGLIFTLVYVAILLIIWPRLLPLLPKWSSGASSVEMSGAPSRAYQKIVSLASGGGWSPEIKFDHVDLTLVPNSGEARILRIDVRPNNNPSRIPLTSADDQLITLRDIRELAPELVGDWMKTSARSDSPALRNEAASVSAETIRLVSSDLSVQHISPDSTPFQSLSFRQWQFPPGLSWRVIGSIDLLAVIVWIAGLAYIWRKDKRARVTEIAHA